MWNLQWLVFKKAFKIVGGERLKKLKILDIPREKIKIGDLVLQRDGRQTYFVIDKDVTFLHNHDYIKVLYKDGKSMKWMVNNLSKIKKVARIV